MKLINIIQKKNNYSGSNWDTEYAKRYLFELSPGKIIEASYFRHYSNRKFIKNVIEMPMTLGCKIKCKFCASSAINNFKKLSYEEMNQIYYSIINEETLRNKKHLITFTGIGEINNNLEALKIFINHINNKDIVEFTFSTIDFNNVLFDFIEDYKNKIIIRRFQITYLSYKSSTISDLVPTFNQKKYNIHNVIHLIKHIDDISIRINFVIIKNINDNESEVNNFIELFDKIKHKIRIRISKLNSTPVSIRNGLHEPEISVLESINQILISKGFDSYCYYTNINDNLNCGQLVFNYDGNCCYDI